MLPVFEMLIISSTELLFPPTPYSLDLVLFVCLKNSDPKLNYAVLFFSIDLELSNYQIM